MDLSDIRKNIPLSGINAEIFKPALDGELNLSKDIILRKSSFRWSPWKMESICSKFFF